MKQLMKSAALLASVGAVLCFAGCKEKTPQEQLADIMGAVDEECAKLGIKPLCGVQVVEKARTISSEEAQKQLIEVKPSVDAFMEYVNILKDIDSELRKFDVALSDTEVDIFLKLEAFLKDSTANRQTAINDMRNTKKKLDGFTETIRKVNEIAVKKGGNPYLDKRQMKDAILGFVWKKSERQDSDLKDAQRLLMNAKEL